MKKIPKNRPPRYIFEWVEEKKEYRCKKKYRFTDYTGKKRGSDTKWHWTIEECEEEAKKKIYEASIDHYQDLRKKTLSEVLDLYVEKLRKKAYRESNIKISGDINNYDKASGLRMYLKPDLANININEMDSSHWRQWIKWINDEDEDEHKTLGGKRVRALKNAMFKFNTWLADEGYISNDAEDINKASIQKVEIKKVETGARHRNYPSYQDIQQIAWYYRNNDISKFKNLYWNTLWQVLYYTGMRVGELIALRWSNVEFDDENPRKNVIRIRDAINHKEKRSNVARRFEAENLETKNESSIRNITMWAVYRSAFEDYKTSYRYHYNISETEMKNAFVFPNISARDPKDNTPFSYQDQKNMLRELNRITEIIGIEKTDCQMFRHGCAYFLRDTMHVSAAEAHDYFGHADSKMIEQVYAKSDVELKQKRADFSLMSLITDKPFTEDYNEYLYGKKDDSAVVAGAEVDKMNFILSFSNELEQIKEAYAKGKRTYYYSKKNKDIILAIMDSIKAQKEEYGVAAIGEWLLEMTLLPDEK